MKPKIPPPLILLIMAGLMWLASAFIVQLRFLFPWQNLLALLFTLAGLGLIVSARLTFLRHDTTINPLKPETASTLVTSGPFAYTRNPMYLGLTLILFGWFIYLGQALNAVFIVLFVMVTTYFQILPEERALATNFDREYETYRSRVRRWL